MQMAFYLAGEITQVKESIPWVRCASGNVFGLPCSSYQVVAKWSPCSHQVVTMWSTSSYQVVTMYQVVAKWAPSSHQMVTK